MALFKGNGHGAMVNFNLSVRVDDTTIGNVRLIDKGASAGSAGHLGDNLVMVRCNDVVGYECAMREVHAVKNDYESIVVVTTYRLQVGAIRREDISLEDGIFRVRNMLFRMFVERNCRVKTTITKGLLNRGTVWTSKFKGNLCNGLRFFTGNFVRLFRRYIMRNERFCVSTMRRNCNLVALYTAIAANTRERGRCRRGSGYRCSFRVVFPPWPLDPSRVRVPLGVIF